MYLPVFILCFIPSILAGVLHVFVFNKKERKNIAQAVIYYMLFFYGVLSIVKMSLDGGSLTLIECFADTYVVTYYHYLLPLMFLAVIVPITFSFVSRKINISAALPMFRSLMFLVIATGYIIMDKITNRLYVSTFVASIVVAVTTVFLPCKIEYCRRTDIKYRIRYAVPVTLFYVVTVVLIIPLTLFFNNISEMPITSGAVTAALWIGAIIQFIIIVCGGTVLLTHRQFELFYTFLFALTLTGYIQNMFLNGHMLLMDGTDQSWEEMQMYGNIVVWIIMILAVIGIKAFCHKNISKVYSIICGYLAAVQIVSLGYLTVSTFDVNKEHNDKLGYILSTDGALELNEKNNVFVFILDWYDEQILQKILETEPEFLAPLDGFTHYSNATSLYAFTDMSLPYLTVGGGGIKEPPYGNGTMLEDISEAGYDISVYTEPKYLPQQLLDKIDNWTTYKPKYYGFDTVRLMLKCSKYQISPFILKDNYSYKTDDFSTLRKNDFTVWEVDYDYPFWNALKDTGLSISDKTSIGSFKLYHMYGAHPSFNMTEDFMPVDYLGNYEAMISQAKGSLKIVYEYLNQLKALGLYDSSEIYITADHGENYLYDSYRFVLLEKRKLINTSSPILLVKHAHSTWKGVHESKAPVSHTEMIASIINTIVPQNTAKYGQTLEDIGEMQERKRIFIFDRGDMPYVKVEINGDVLNPDNWTIVERISLEDKKRSNN